MKSDENLLSLLCCPKCKSELTLSPDNGLICCNCKLIYPIKDKIPIMLIDEAKNLE
ncbi:MAG: Trm112 family protein [Bacteroidota bacterium]